MSWFEAVRYCEWLTAQTGRHFRLPTEAEWERAARGGGEGALFPWGNVPPESLQGYAGRRWQTGPEPVGQVSANEYGLYNMCDNVHELCADWYAPGYYVVSPDRNPRGPETGDRRASRGGSWRHHIKVTRCAARSSIPPEFQYADYGSGRLRWLIERQKSDCRSKINPCAVTSQSTSHFCNCGLLTELASLYLDEIRRQLRGHKRMAESAMVN